MSITSPAGFDWISSTTGQDTVLLRQYLSSGPHQPRRDRSLPGFADIDLLALPERQVAEQAIAVLAGPFLQRVFPILNGRLVTETIEAAYGAVVGNGPSVKQLSATACLFALRAVMSLLSRKSAAATSDGAIFTSRAQSLLSSVGDFASLDGLQAYLLLVSKRVHSATLTRLTSIESYRSPQSHSISTTVSWGSMIQTRSTRPAACFTSFEATFKVPL